MKVERSGHVNGPIVPTLGATPHPSRYAPSPGREKPLAHNTSGLPPLDIEPFDPSPLYAAASSPDRAANRGLFGGRARVLALVLTVVLVIAVVAGAIALL